MKIAQPFAAMVCMLDVARTVAEREDALESMRATFMDAIPRRARPRRRRRRT